MDASHPPRRLPYLPVEILTIVFFAVLASSNSSAEALTALKDVFRYWRNIILNNPALWSTLELSYWAEGWHDDAGIMFSPSRQLFEAANRFLASPVVHKPSSLIMRIPYNYELRESMYNPAAGRPDVFARKFAVEGWLEPQVTSRMRRAEFVFDPVLALNLFVVLPIDLPRRNTPNPWNQLTTLKLNAASGQRMPGELVDIVHEEGQLAATMPNLVDLELIVHVLKLWKRLVPWEQLRRLILRVEEESMEDLLETISKCQYTLQECHLRAITFLGPEEERPDILVPVRFPVLKVFRLHILPTTRFNEDDEPDLPLAIVGDPLNHFLKSVEFPEALGVWLCSGAGTVRIDHSAFMQFTGFCVNLRTLHLGFLKFVIPAHIQSNSRAANDATASQIYTSVLKSLPKSITNFGISARVRKHSREPTEFLWLADTPTLECGSFLPNLRLLQVSIAGQLSITTNVWVKALEANMYQLAARRCAEKKPMTFRLLRHHDHIASIAFGAPFTDEYLEEEEGEGIEGVEGGTEDSDNIEVEDDEDDEE